jgi:hypothetical protein
MTEPTPLPDQLPPDEAEAVPEPDPGTPYGYEQGEYPAAYPTDPLLAPVTPAPDEPLPSVTEEPEETPPGEPEPPPAG